MLERLRPGSIRRESSGEARGHFDSMGWERQLAAEIPVSHMPTLSTEHCPLAEGMSHWSQDGSCIEYSDPLSELLDTESKIAEGELSCCCARDCQSIVFFCSICTPLTAYFIRP